MSPAYWLLHMASRDPLGRRRGAHAPCSCSCKPCGWPPGAGLSRACQHPASSTAHPDRAGQTAGRAGWGSACNGGDEEVGSDAVTVDACRPTACVLRTAPTAFADRKNRYICLRARSLTHLCGSRWSSSLSSMYQASIVASSGFSGCNQYNRNLLVRYITSAPVLKQFQQPVGGTGCVAS